MHGYNDHDVLYQNCEIHDPLVRGSDISVEPIWLFSEIVLNLSKYSSLLPYIYLKKKTKYMVMMSVKPYTKMIKFMARSVSGVQALGRGQ